MSYYIVIPTVFGMKATFDDRVTDAQALAFGEIIYDIVGVYILLFVGAIFLNAYQKSTRNSSISAFG